MHVRKRLGEMLIEAGVIDAGQLQTALAHQRKWGGKLGQAIVDLRMAAEEQIVTSLSRKLGYEAVNVAALQRTPELEQALKMVPAEVALRHTVLPVAMDASSLSVVMSDPSNIAVVDELAFRTGRRIKISLAGDRLLQAAVHRFYVLDEDSRRGVVHRLAPSTPAPAGVAPGAPPPRGTPVPGLSGSAAPRTAPAGGSAQATPSTQEPVLRREPPAGERQLTPREAALLDSIQRAARGEETALVKPPQLVAAVVRILVRKGLVTEAELIAELGRPS